MPLPSSVPLAVLAALVAGCAAPTAPVRPTGPAAITVVGLPTPPKLPPLPEQAVPASPAPAPAAAPVRTDPDLGGGVAAALAYADRARGLPAPELAQEINRLSAAAGPMAQLQLALALQHTRVPADALRAQALVQRVLAQDAAAALHPFARHLQWQLAEHRRVEEQLERQAQQLRDAQRRNEQLSDRLDALRAIERSRPRAP